MVAKEISHCYPQLLHQSHQPQEYISLEELGPRLNQEHLNQNHQYQQDQNQIYAPTTFANQLYQYENYQQPSHYNLTNVQE